MKSNLVKNEIDRDNRILLVYHDYRLFGWILMVASLLPLTTLLAMPSPAISVVLVLMGGIPLAVGANLVFKERRRLWNRDSANAYPGTRSWVLGVFPNKKFRPDAEELAEFASTECDLPIRDDLAR